jgi:hypothetical protein
MGVVMSSISIAMRSVPEAQADHHSPKAITLFCCFGLVTSVCLMTFGMDLSTGWL